MQRPTAPTGPDHTQQSRELTKPTAASAFGDSDPTHEIPQPPPTSTIMPPVPNAAAASAASSNVAPPPPPPLPAPQAAALSPPGALHVRTRTPSTGTAPMSPPPMSPTGPSSANSSPRGPAPPLIPSTTGNRRILVTGAAGFIGFHTSWALLARGEDVVIIDELNDYYDVRLKEANLADLVRAFTAERVLIYRGDLCDQGLVRRVLRETRPEAMIHLAARAGVRPSIDNPLLYIHSNVTATTVLLEACRRYGIRKFVYASSSSVYGGSTRASFSEDDIVDAPVSPYAATKKSCELLAHTYHHLYRMDCIGLRFFTVYGPRGRPDMAPFKFMDRIARGVAIEQFGDGRSSRDYTYIDDIVQGVLLSLDRAHGCEVFNLGNGAPTLLRDFIRIIEGLVGREAVIRELPNQPGDVPRTCANVDKAKRMLGYQPTTPLAQGLAKTWAWYKAFYPPPPVSLTPLPTSDSPLVSSSLSSSPSPSSKDKSMHVHKQQKAHTAPPQPASPRSPLAIKS